MVRYNKPDFELIKYTALRGRNICDSSLVPRNLDQDELPIDAPAPKGVPKTIKIG